MVSFDREFDFDHDGVLGEADCDDNDPMRHPGAEEACEDGIDQDCDGFDALCDDDDSSSGDSGDDDNGENGKSDESHRQGDERRNDSSSSSHSLSSAISPHQGLE
jgi:hypothetical protein